MNYRNALNLIEVYLKEYPTYHRLDLYIAVGTFLPLMQAAAQIEAEGQIPYVTTGRKEKQPRNVA